MITVPQAPANSNQPQRPKVQPVFLAMATAIQTQLAQQPRPEPAPKQDV